MKNKILFYLQLPPPVHGSSVVGKMIANNINIRDDYHSIFLNSLLSLKTTESNRFNLGKIFSYLRLVRSFTSAVHSKKPDLFYMAMTATGIGFLKDLPFILYCKVCKIKVVIHLHSKGINKYSRNKIYNIFYRLAFKNSKVIVLSEQLKADIPDYVFPRDVYICNNGIKKSVYKAPKNHRPCMRILFISNLIETKGIYIFLEALRLLVEKNIPFVGTIVGGEADISRDELLKRINDLGLAGHVEYLGKLFGSRKEKIYNESDILVFPTYYKNEAFPLVILEALMYGIPTISTNEGGIADIIETDINGILIRKEDPYACFLAIQKLINQPEIYKKISSNSIKKFNKMYTEEIFDKRIYKILRGIINE